MGRLKKVVQEDKKVTEIEQKEWEAPDLIARRKLRESKYK